MKYYKLHLIRHGLSQGNLVGLYVGSATDLPLCAEGRAQLKTLRKDFVYPRVDTLFVSPLLRAKETAEILFPEARHTYEITNLKEMNFGKFEGRPVTELVKDPEFAAWMDPTCKTVPEGAEDRVAFYKRSGEVLMQMFEFMMKTGTTEAACVTHGGVLMNMLAQHAIPQHKPEDWMADPGCGYTVQCDTAMWMRDKIVEAVDVLPYGYLDNDPDAPEA